MRILLFDIDGTLIRSGGAGKIALHQALQTEFGVREIIDRVNFAGRTDPGIGVDLLTLHQLEVSDANLRKLESGYLNHLPQALKDYQGMVLPGVLDWLEPLQHHEQVHLGLLTGNIRRGAELKLRHYGLWDYFRFGGFADGIPDRNEVARQAVRESEKYLGRKVDANSVWVLGDTPLDVQCARAIGAKVIILKTGWHTPEELIASKPDYLFDDLVAAKELLQQIL